MTIHLRAYHPDDFAAIVRIWHESWHSIFPGFQHPWSYEQWQERFQQKVQSHSSIWVAENNSQIAGFIVVRVDNGYLDQIFVAPARQQQGIGKLLLNKAKELSPNGLYLETLQRNERARHFYERHGFLPGRTGINPNNGQPNIEYRWTPQAARIS